MAAGRHHRRRRRCSTSAGSSLPAIDGDLAGVEIVEVDGLVADADAVPTTPSACSASRRLGLTRSAPAVAASSRRLPDTSTATVPPCSWTARSGSGGPRRQSGRHAATDRDEAPASTPGRPWRDVVPVAASVSAGPGSLITVVLPSASMTTVVPRSSPSTATAVTAALRPRASRRQHVRADRERADEVGRCVERQGCPDTR